MPIRPIQLGNRYEVEAEAHRKDLESGVLGPAIGLLTLEVWLSDEDGGSELDVSLRLSMTERSETPGHYFASFSGSDIDDYFTNTVWVDKPDPVFIVVGDGSDILTSNPTWVKSARRAAV